MNLRRWGSFRRIAAGLIALGLAVLTDAPRALGTADDPSFPSGHAEIDLAPDQTIETLQTISEETFPEAPDRPGDKLTPVTEADVAAVGEAILPSRRLAAELDAQLEEYDPWEPFNDKTFWVNRKFDQYLLRPVATAYDTVVPDVVQESLKNALTNVGVVRRVVNNVLQLNFGGAGREVGRFLINSTLGVAGFFDVAKAWFGIEKSERDSGQTLGAWGVGPGPYLVLPFLPPLTLRDGVGFAVDVALDPLIYFAPFAALAGRTGATFVNDRSLNLELYETVEITTLDFYSAVRNAYLQRRETAVAEARATTQPPPQSLELSVGIRPATR